MYILCRTQNSHVRYVPLYILSFPLCAPRRILDAQVFQRKYRRYEEIQNIPDRLRWLRHSKGLTQEEAAAIAGVGREVYIQAETGVTQYIPLKLAQNLAAHYKVPLTDLMDEFNQFCLDGQVQRITAYRKKLGMEKKPFCRFTGIPQSSLREWESGRKAISYPCWEKYFKGRA